MRLLHTREDKQSRRLMSPVFLEIFWGLSRLFFEKSGEITSVFKIEFISNLFDGLVAGNQLAFSFYNQSDMKQLRERLVHLLFENLVEALFT